MDLESDSEFEPTLETPAHALNCPHTDPECNGCWAKYPQSLFPNWTPRQVKRSDIENICARSDIPCVIHHVDVGENAEFSNAEKDSVSGEANEVFWKMMRETVSEDLCQCHDGW
jgi:hypothetical protein